ncbi:hypothetical protein BJ508DRAFT_360073 [Ascobolus immersus RN42]|uniref:Uncharacterized protein n=1 Tax=Ascobolus immersus RN42 TaxID=1160509 RepID=A0A3N4IIS4_ASCIM|nr:hypothetical protein BJ508DRAFT_360073 [Ascobolus immersus RN42]
MAPIPTTGSLLNPYSTASLFAIVPPTITPYPTTSTDTSKLLWSYCPKLTAPANSLCARRIRHPDDPVLNLAFPGDLIKEFRLSKLPASVPESDPKWKGNIVLNASGADEDTIRLLWDKAEELRETFGEYYSIIAMDFDRFDGTATDDDLETVSVEMVVKGTGLMETGVRVPKVGVKDYLDPGLMVIPEASDYYDFSGDFVTTDGPVYPPDYMIRRPLLSPDDDGEAFESEPEEPVTFTELVAVGEADQAPEGKLPSEAELANINKDSLASQPEVFPILALPSLKELLYKEGGEYDVPKLTAAELRQARESEAAARKAAAKWNNLRPQ